MPKATYKIVVDWDNDGDFGDTGEDITADVMNLESFRGRDYASQLTGRSRAGTLILLLENSGNTYNSFNSGSAIFGNILPGRKVQVQTNDSFPYTFPIVFAGTPIWTGFLDSVTPQPSVHGAHRATLRAVGALEMIQPKLINAGYNTSYRTDQAVTDILTDAGWPVADRQLQTGKTTMGYWWAENKPGLVALQEVEETEMGFVWEKADGKISFDDRHYRLTNSKSYTSQRTLTDASGSNVEYSQIEQHDPIREIYNWIEATVRRFTTGGLATLWTLSESGANSPAIEVGESRIWWAEYPNPDSSTNAVGVNAWTNTTTVTDMAANSQADGGGDDLTASIAIASQATGSKYGNRLKITLTNNATVTAYITLLQARGTPLTADDPVKVIAEDSTSQTAYDVRTYPIDAPWIPDTTEAVDYTNAVLVTYKDPIPVLSVMFSANRNQTHMAEALIREIDERVTLVATGNAGLGINEDFYVEAIRHKIDQHKNHWVVYDLSPVADYSGFWALDVSLLGASTRVGY